MREFRCGRGARSYGRWRRNHAATRRQRMRNSLLFLALAGALAVPAANAQVLGLGGNGGGAIQAGPVNVGGHGAGNIGGNVGGLTESTRTIDSVGARVRDSA